MTRTRPDPGNVGSVSDAIRAIRPTRALACALALTLGACVPAAPADDLPSPVATLIDQASPGYSWSGAERNARHIGRGDFDANGLDDVALLLRGTEDWQLVVYRQLEEDSYRAEVIEQFPGKDQDFTRRYPLDELELEAAAPGTALDIDGTVVEATADDTATLALLLPSSERTALLFPWDPDHDLFGTTQIRLAAADAGASCAYDPQSGKPSPLGMRASVTVEEQAGDTTFVYEQFPEPLLGAAPATLATRRELVFHDTPIDQARALMREQPSYYQELTGDDDPGGFAPVDASLNCR